MRTPLLLAALLIAACAPEAKFEEGVPPSSDTLTVDERFDALYIGRWSESGACTGSETVWQIGDDMIRAGGRTCAIEDLSSGTNVIAAELTDCTRAGDPVRDREIALDVAGTDILYLTTSDDRRLRLERCPSLDGAKRGSGTL